MLLENTSEILFLDQLRHHGQESVFSNDLSDSQMEQLLNQAHRLDRSYPGGLINYITRARKLLEDSSKGLNVFEDVTPAVPSGVSLELGSDEFDMYEAIGSVEAKSVCFVLVAGGLGERLGYPGIKIGIPVESSTNSSYLDFYLKCIDSMQKKFGVSFPFVIMTSDDTDSSTRQLLKDNYSFDQVVILKQEKVAALIDVNATLSVSKTEEGEISIDTKPHGHGDIHTLIHQSGLVPEWLEKGFKWMFIFQDTNALAFHALYALLGVSKKHSFAMNTCAVARTPGESVGALCKLIKADGTSMTVNVEYNQLDPLLKSSSFKGDVPLPGTNKSAFPGNTNILLLNLQRYGQVLETSGGAMPEFVNPKYAKDQTKFKTPTRLECMMQDISRLFLTTDNVGFTELERWLCFSTIKNNNTDAAVKTQQGLSSESLLSGESDYYYANSQLLKHAVQKAGGKFVVGDRTIVEHNGVSYPIGPSIILEPSFGFTLFDISTRIRRGCHLTISEGSFLRLAGPVNIQSLHIERGVLDYTANELGSTITDMKILTGNYSIHPVEDNDFSKPLHSRLRGYYIKIESPNIIN